MRSAGRKRLRMHMRMRRGAHGEFGGVAGRAVPEGGREDARPRRALTGRPGTVLGGSARPPHAPQPAGPCQVPRAIALGWTAGHRDTPAAPSPALRPSRRSPRPLSSSPNPGGELPLQTQALSYPCRGVTVGGSDSNPGWCPQGVRKGESPRVRRPQAQHGQDGPERGPQVLQALQLQAGQESVHL